MAHRKLVLSHLKSKLQALGLKIPIGFRLAFD